MQEQFVIHVESLRKRYGTVTAVDGVSFQVQTGEIFGMVGPNGSGKTTFMDEAEQLCDRVAVLVVIGKLVFDLHIAGSWLSVLSGFILSTLAFFSAGYLLASLAPTARVAQAVGMVIFFPMMFLSGAGMPLQLLPEALRKVSEFLPLTYVVRLLQGLWFGDAWSSLWLPTLILVGILVVGTAASVRFFRWE